MSKVYLYWLAILSMVFAADFVLRVYTPLPASVRDLHEETPPARLPQHQLPAELRQQLLQLRLPAKVETDAQTDPFADYDGRSFGQQHLTLLGIYRNDAELRAVFAVRQDGSTEVSIVRATVQQQLQDVLVERISPREVELAYQQQRSTLRLFDQSALSKRDLVHEHD